jgi:hypothetical protein
MKKHSKKREPLFKAALKDGTRILVRARTIVITLWTYKKPR